MSAQPTLQILYENADLVVAVKPAGVLAASAAGADLLSLAATVCGVPTLYPVHRLDRQVGGVCVLAKTPAAATDLTRHLQAGNFGKQYLAVASRIPAQPTGTLTDLLYHDKRTNKTFVVDRKRAGVKPASLAYRTIATVAAPYPCALVEVTLHTGRTHQIRVQFASRGLPLVGDRKYGGPAAAAMGLFANSLTFPVAGKARTFVATPPDCEPFAWF